MASLEENKTSWNSPLNFGVFIMNIFIVFWMVKCLWYQPRQCCGSKIIYRIRIRDYNFGSGSDKLQFSVTEIAGNLLSTSGSCQFYKGKKNSQVDFRNLFFKINFCASEGSSPPPNTTQTGLPSSGQSQNYTTQPPLRPNHRRPTPAPYRLATIILNHISSDLKFLEKSDQEKMILDPQHWA